MANVNENKDRNNRVKVTFTHTNTGRTTNFDVEKNTKFDDVINEAYGKLGETRKGTDKFFCINGTPLNDQLDTIVQAVISSKCKEAKFEIRGETGGAYFFS